MWDSGKNPGTGSKILAEIFRLSEKQINNYLKSYTSDYLNEKIQYVLNTPSFKSGNIKNIGGYLKTAIKSDYQNSISSSLILFDSKKEAEERARQEKNIKDAMHDAQRAYESFIRKSLLKVLEELEPSKSEAIFNAFSEYLQRENQIIFKTYRRSKFKSAIVSVSLKTFIKNNYQDIFNKFSDFSNYVREFFPNLVPYLKANGE